MGFKNYFIIILFFIFIFFGGVVSANENTTEVFSITENNNDIIENELLKIEEQNNEDICINNNETDFLTTSNIENSVGIDGGTFSDDDSISFTGKNVVVNYKTKYKYEVKVVNKISNLPLANYPIEVSLTDGGAGDSFDGYTNSEGVFQFSLHNLWAGSFKVSARIMTDSINHEGYYRDDFATIKINKISAVVTAKKLKGTTAYSILKVTVKEKNGNIINDKHWAPEVKFIINGKSYTAWLEKDVAKINVKLPKAKTYTYKATLIHDNYKSNTATSKIIVKQSKAKISAKKVKGTTSSTILKAIVKNSNGKRIDGGTVKFIINGKSYIVKVLDGVATKKLKLNKKGAYVYKAIFSSKYYSKDQDSSKAIVKKVKIKKYYSVKIGKYSAKIPIKDYKKIKKALTKGYFSKDYYTGKKIKYKVYKDKKVTFTKKKIYMDSWPTGYKTYSSASNTPKGYNYYGTEAKKVGNHIKRYVVYKKTGYKKVLVKTPKTKVYISINSHPKRGVKGLIYYLKDKYNGENHYYATNFKKVKLV